MITHRYFECRCKVTSRMEIPSARSPVSKVDCGQTCMFGFARKKVQFHFVSNTHRLWDLSPKSARDLTRRKVCTKVRNYDYL